MKIKYLCSLLTAALVLSAVGCGEQKQPEKQESDAAEKPGLESKIEEGWNPEKKCFGCIIGVPGSEKNQSKSMPRFQLEGMLQALGKFGKYLQDVIVPTEKGKIKTVSTLTFGSLQLKTEDEKIDSILRTKISITRGEEQLYFLEEKIDKEKEVSITHRGKLLYSRSGREKRDGGLDIIQEQNNVTARDVDLFKSEMEANGLKISMIDYEADDGFIQMAFSIQLLSGKQ